MKYDGDYLRAVICDEKSPPANDKVWFSTNPMLAVIYAKYKKKSRYSEKLERLFYGHARAIYSYAYWIINDLGQEVPEHLHNYMIAQSLAGSSEKDWVNLYFEILKNKNKQLVK